MAALSRLASLWRNVFHGRQVERDLDEEVRAYVALLAEEKTKAGMSPGEALRAASNPGTCEPRDDGRSVARVPRLGCA